MVKPGTISEIRFGYGFAPWQPDRKSGDDLLAEVGRVDSAEKRRSLLRTSERLAILSERREARNGSQEDKDRANRNLRSKAADDFQSILLRMVESKAGFRERLVAFWTDHFTVAVNAPVLSLLIPDFIENAVRPHVGGNFKDMLQATSLHPAMVIYLNQVQSAGPNSVAGQRRDRGLNENLAREILELHSLGVGGAYSQTDVRELAELLTGVSVDKSGFKFRANMAEPGPETILGKTYGGGSRASLDDVKGALADIAVHPDTARHLSTKLLVHFIGGTPPEDLVERMANGFLAADGDLMALYEVMLADPRSWEPPFRKVKPPMDFIVSALRAGAPEPEKLAQLDQRQVRRALSDALTSMGQPIFRPAGPDGWPEDPSAWITPAGLAARLRWVQGFVDALLDEKDPRKFLQTTLDDAASDLLRRAVGGAESRKEGVALVLASPDFNRR
ncbi:MAG: DUF1800 domain-containing protein [Boseongicola sp.]|nr:DUF1800 domain-containing protein [Boseongicola sp.]